MSYPCSAGMRRWFRSSSRRLSSILILLISFFSGLSASAFAAAGALHFEQTDSASASIPSGAMEAFTLEFSFRRLEAGGEQIALFSPGSGYAPASEWTIAIRAQDQVLLGSGRGPSGFTTNLAGTSPVTLGEWHHAAVTYDGTTMKLYLDGTLQGSSPILTGINAPNAFLRLRSTKQTEIAEVRLWNYARSLTELIGTRNQRLFTETGLLARWGFEEGTGTSAANSGTVSAAMTLAGADFVNGPTPAPGTPPQVSISNVTPGASFPVHTGFPVTCAAADGDGTVSRLELYLGSTLVAQDETAPYHFVVTPTVTRPDQLRAVAVDNDGLTRTSAISINITPPPGGSGLYFDGVDDYVQIDPSPGLACEQFTIETWMRKEGPSGAADPLFSASIGTPLVFRGDRMPSNQISFNYSLSVTAGTNSVVLGMFSCRTDYGTYRDIGLAGTTPLVGGVWYHLAMTYDGRSLRLYVNGDLDASQPMSETPLTAASLRTSLGRAQTSTGERSSAFHGYLDEVRIWNHARSQAAIAADRWRTQFSDPALLAQWSMQEGAGPTLTSTGTATATGTISGAIRTIDHPAPASPPPSVSLAANGSRTLGQYILFEATPTAGTVTVERVEFYSNGAKLGEVLAAPWEWNFLPSAVGRYVVHAVVYDSQGGTASSDDSVIDITPVAGTNALYFDGEDDYVELPPRAEFTVTTFTLEMWMRADGQGRPSLWQQNLGWVTPVITQGSGALSDIFLGLTANGTLVAATDGINGIFAANTPLQPGVWSHVAIVYDGTFLRFYINGIPDRVASPIFQSNRYIAGPTFGAALQYPNPRTGAFHGCLDEVRLWSVARTGAEIAANLSREIQAAPGLAARYGFDEPNGLVITDSAGSSLSGLLRNGVFRTTGAGLVQNAPPAISGLQPSNGATLATPVTLSATVDDPDGDALSGSLLGREIPRDTEDFTIAVLPESSNYTASLNGGSPSILNAMLDWIVANRATEKIVCVIQTGVVAPAGAAPFNAASAAFAKLEDPVTTGLSAGLPYCLERTGLEGSYVDSHFGASRFTGRPWFIGTNGTNGNVPNPGLVFFTAGGIDFGVVQDSFYAALSNQLTSWPDRQMIVLAYSDSHLATARQSPNVPLILQSRTSGESRTITASGGRVVNTLNANFRDRPNGGDGWMRLLRFSPAKGQISVKTWSPTRAEFERDTDSEFTMPWKSPLRALTRSLISTQSPGIGGTLSIPWPQASAGKRYEWTAQASDGTNVVSSEPRIFDTAPPPGGLPPSVSITAPLSSTTVMLPSTLYVTANATSAEDSIERVEWIANGLVVATDFTAPYSSFWRPGAPGSYQLSAAALDRRGLRSVSPPLTVTVNTNTGAGSVSAAVTPFSTGSTLYDAGTITISATASGSFTNVTAVDFFVDGEWIGTDSAFPYRAPWTYSGTGQKRIQVMATGANGTRIVSSVYPVDVTPLLNPSVNRHPSLYRPSPASVTVRWQTSQLHPGRVWYGVTPSALTSFVDEEFANANHAVRIAGLQPNTRYYYGIGSPSKLVTDNRAATYFITPPATGRAKNTRIWAVGDAGQGNPGQLSTRSGYNTFTAARETDLILSLGDQAYNTGASTEFQSKFFDPYAALLRRAFCFPTLGERDTNGSTTFSASIPYYSSFLLPSAGESGGVPSNTDRYYSYDFANIHFVCLDSQTSDRSASGPMATWLNADLAATNAHWKIAFWHHSPYSKGGQDSDSGTAQTQMREVFVPILEQYGVDLVLGSHSRNYERSWLISGHTGSASTFQEGMKKSSGLGNPTVDGPYVKSVGASASGTVYVVAGHAASLDTGAPLSHPAMAISRSELGSLVIDVNGAQMDCRMVNAASAVADYFTILKPWSGPDSDNDGLPDAFEMAYGFDASLPHDALADFDGDGVTNRNEYGFGTDPTDSKSRPLRSIERVGTSFVVRFSTLPAIRYLVEYSESLASNSWAPIGPEIVGTGQEAAVTDNPPAESRVRIYRVRSRP